MNKNLIVYIISTSLIGTIGMASTMYAGRKSYKQGVQDGWATRQQVQEVLDHFNKAERGS